MESGDGPSGGKRGAPRVDASSLALVALVLAVCQTTLVRAGKTLSLLVGFLATVLNAWVAGGLAGVREERAFI